MEAGAKIHHKPHSMGIYQKYAHFIYKQLLLKDAVKMIIKNGFGDKSFVFMTFNITFLICLKIYFDEI